MKHLEFGEPKGKIVVYFHGAPGSPEEASIFHDYAKENNLNIICFDRFSIDTSLQSNEYYKFLASNISEQAKGQKIDVVGFSIGCHAAIETSLHLGNVINSMHLISPAAPLDDSDFINKMAGKTIFKLAKKNAALFKVVSFLQAVLAILVPNVLFKLLFSSAAGEDAALSKTREFKQYISPVLGKCFTVNLAGYIREVQQYVMPWSNLIKQCIAPVQLWHGASDNWSPIDMANYLNSNLPNVKNLQVFDNLSHYSCLYAAVPLICNQLKKQ